jgi:hypothetical protein
MSKLEYNESSEKLIHISEAGKPILFTSSSIKILGIRQNRKGDIKEILLALSDKESLYIKALEKQIIQDLKEELIDSGIKKLKSVIKRIGDQDVMKVKPVFKKSFKTTYLDINRKIVCQEEINEIVVKNKKIHLVIQPYAVWKVNDQVGVYLRPIQVIGSSSE